MKLALFIGLAGGLGSMSRYLLGSWVTAAAGQRAALPLGTLTVNILGSLLMGLLVALFLSRGEADSRLKMVLTVGFLGGFTTYSSFALDTIGLLENRNYPVASLYLALTFLGAALACYVGLSIGRRF